MLGNWVMAKEPASSTIAPMYITSIFNDTVYTSFINGYAISLNNQNDIYGLPLSEDLLLKCVFDKDEQSNKYHFRYDTTLTIEFIEDHIDVYYGEKIIKTNIKYLHELQNFLFAVFRIDLELEIDRKDY